MNGLEATSEADAAAFIAIGMGSLLAHRKQILQCTFCRAVIPAS